MKYFNSPSLYATICLLLIAVGCQQAGTVDPDKFQDSSANAAKLSPEEQIAKVVAGLRDFPEEMPARSADQTYVRLYLPKMF